MKNKIIYGTLICLSSFSAGFIRSLSLPEDKAATYFGLVFVSILWFTYCMFRTQK